MAFTRNNALELVKFWLEEQGTYNYLGELVSDFIATLGDNGPSEEGVALDLVVQALQEHCIELTDEEYDTLKSLIW